MLVRRVITPIRFARGTRAPAVARGLSTTTARPSVAVVGVGQMGAAVAANLLRSAVDVHLFDLAGAANVPPALQQGQLAGATWAATAAEAARAASVVITALPRPENVSAAFEAPGGLLEGLRPGTTWIEHSTTDFENTLRIKDAIEARGCFAVEAPLTGGMQVLREGKMVVLVGAADDVFDGPIEELVALSAPRIVRCGAFGHATVIKLFSNMLCAAHDCAVGEALCVAKKHGLDMKLVFDAMRVSSGNSFCWETEVPLVLTGSYDPNFTARMMHKDISLGLELARRHGVPQPMNELVLARYERAIEAYGEHQGSTIPVKLIEDASGAPLAHGAGNAREALANWSYTTEITDGSFQVIHNDVENPYL